MVTNNMVSEFLIGLGQRMQDTHADDGTLDDEFTPYNDGTDRAEPINLYDTTNVNHEFTALINLVHGQYDEIPEL